MSQHPTPEDLAAFSRGELDARTVRTVVRHLLRGCTSCCAVTAAGLSLYPSPTRAITSGVYDDAIDRAAVSVLGYQRKKDREKQKIQRIVDRLDAEGIAALTNLTPASRGPALAEALLERSWALRHQDPEQMAELARLAVLAARDLDPRAHGLTEVTDLRSRTYAEYGNACRVTERLDEAEQAFDRSYTLHQEGSQEPLALARLFDLRSSLYRAKRQLSNARTALRIAHSIYLNHGETHLAGRALVNMGIYTGCAGEPMRALELLEKGLSMVDGQRDPELLFFGIHNQIWFMVECDRFEAAQRMLFLHRGRYEGASRLNRLKLRWMEARIDAGLGKLARAEGIFEEVRHGLTEEGQDFPAALASLDLALTQMRQGRTNDAGETVMEAAETFRALRIHRESLTALLFLRETFSLGLLKSSLLEDVISFLRRAEHDPSAKFEPRAI